MPCLAEGPHFSTGTERGSLWQLFGKMLQRGRRCLRGFGRQQAVREPIRYLSAVAMMAVMTKDKTRRLGAASLLFPVRAQGQPTQAMRGQWKEAAFWDPPKGQGSQGRAMAGPSQPKPPPALDTIITIIVVIRRRTIIAIITIETIVRKGSGAAVQRCLA